MKFGYFVGVNWKTRKVCFNSVLTTLEEFKAEKAILDSRDVLGPMQTEDEAVQLRDRVAEFCKAHAHRKVRGIATLQDLHAHGMLSVT